ncbi:hypothetical protein HanXRQr2_Chr03g0125571 [Helianthus annuus]|uniref:Uncharacterized protein n=1 Tax=Helianthus annuus TaxID=4232 RepID=A0A9K3JJ77_HELAN|nr:hypothetical protein HanXRQr2_Chr07g0305001 [Helianthus annuus]KAF5815667.1 hypothetical protein HanXRQr2_Chr03g0125571 [Helianthus annuus]
MLYALVPARGPGVSAIVMSLVCSLTRPKKMSRPHGRTSNGR